MIARTLLAAAFFAAFAAAAPVPARPVLTDEQAAEFDRLWDACQYHAADRAHLYLRLITEPAAATEYLTAKLPPMAMTEEEAKTLLADLDREDEKVWKRAYRALTVRDIRLAMTPQEAWELASGERQRVRLAGLLYGYAGPDDFPAKGVTCELDVKSPDIYEVCLTWDRNGREAVRARFIRVGCAEEMRTRGIEPPATRAGIAVIALERFATPAAKKHLQALADGHEAGHATKVAKVALERLKGDLPKASPPPVFWKRVYRSVERYDESWGNPEVLNQLLAQPKETVALLEKKLKPLTLTEREAKALLAKLFSDDEKVWEAALAEMDTFDVRLAMTATDAWTLADTPTAKRRLKAALAGSSDWDRAETLDDSLLARRWEREAAAVRVLDAIGTDDALAVVKAMAGGHEDAGPTRVAKEVLKRRGVK